MRQAFELDQPPQRHRQWKRAAPSLTPCKVEEAPNSTPTDLWSHFKLLNIGDVVIIRLHNPERLADRAISWSPISVIAVFPTFPVYSCYWTTLHFFIYFLSVSKMQLQHQKRWCQRAHLSVLAALTPERLTSSTLIPGFCVDVRERRLR